MNKLLATLCILASSFLCASDYPLKSYTSDQRFQPQKRLLDESPSFKSKREMTDLEKEIKEMQRNNADFELFLNKVILTFTVFSGCAVMALIVYHTIYNTEPKKPSIYLRQ